MNLLEQELHYPLGDTLAPPGGSLEVAPGVRWLRMKLPFVLDHINLWLLRDEIDGRAGWTVVDCCITQDEAKAQWESVFATQLEGLPILRVMVTHMHPDHIGLAHWLCARWSTPEHDCRLWVSATDYNAARVATRGTVGFGGENAALFFASHGLNDPDSVAQIRARASYFPEMVPAVPDSFRRVLDGMRITIGGRTWRSISGYGHAPEHMAYFCDELKLLISGDMVLPRISTNIAVHDVEPENDPLSLFLDSLNKYKLLPQDTLTLPAHGKPFLGLHTRVRQLHDHHRDRLAEVMQACSQGPHSAAQIMPILFKRELDLHQKTFALGESIAHLHLLWQQGQLARSRGVDGVWRFEAATRAAALRP